MPRQARLDVPGTLHHVIIRGIEKRKIVDDDRDRQEFVSRLGKIATETNTSIYAWAVMNNHAHILLRSGPAGLPGFMKRFLTGYAIYYNQRHQRHGHLFQNRYKSIICEEDPYFQELVRYIHLNPLRGKLVESLASLDRYVWCGHSVLMGRIKREFQDRDYVLKWFGTTEGDAKRAYRKFVKSGIGQGRRSDLTGGGLMRSQGGWAAVNAMRRSGVREKSDERILGGGEFVSQLIEQSDEIRKEQFLDGKGLQHISHLIEEICAKEGVSVEALKAGSRRREVSKIRSRLVGKLVEECGLSLTEAGRQLGVSASAVAITLRRRDEQKRS